MRERPIVCVNDRRFSRGVWDSPVEVDRDASSVMRTAFPSLDYFEASDVRPRSSAGNEPAPTWAKHARAWTAPDGVPTFTTQSAGYGVGRHALNGSRLLCASVYRPDLSRYIATGRHHWFVSCTLPPLAD